MFVCLANILRSSPSINLTIKQANLNHNNVFYELEQAHEHETQFNYIFSSKKKKKKLTTFNIIFLYVCLCKNIQLEIRLYKFVNKFI